jgi:hypothetical protein
MSIHWNLPSGSVVNGGAGRWKESRHIQLRKMEIAGEDKKVIIRLVETGDKVQAACDLINERYSWRGYGSDHRIPLDANHMTFTAEIGQDVVGTITLATDSKNGLATDRTFRQELDEYRAQPGAKLCELTKFAFDATIQSKELMAALFHIVFVYGYRTHGCTDLFIEVNPRHVRFYEAMLGFKRVGALKDNDSVAAPAQLMWLKVDAIRQNINQFASNSDRPNARSLYPFFFSPTEESAIYRRLARTENQVIDQVGEDNTSRGGDHGLFRDFPLPDPAAALNGPAMRGHRAAHQVGPL